MFSRITLLISAVLFAFGCGGSDDHPLIKCGAGTVLIGDTCTVVAPDASVDSSADVTTSMDAAPDTRVEDSAAADVGSDGCADAFAGVINCGETCGGPEPRCAQLECSSATALSLTSYAELPFSFRTAASQPIDDHCPARCTSKEPVFGYQLDLKMPYARYGFIATVDPPWMLDTIYVEDYCPALSSPGKTACLYFDPPTGQIGHLFVYTRFPTAPSEIVRVREAMNGERCP